MDPTQYLSNSGTKKDKNHMPPKVFRDRSENWNDDETLALIDAIDEVQTKRGKVGFSFTEAENNEIYRLFMNEMKDSKRTVEKLVNRIKVLLRRFRVCNDLVNKSGWSWDAENHRPQAPSWDDYMEEVNIQGDKAKFLMKTKFQWYPRMVSMVSGQTSTGFAFRRSWDGTDPPPPSEEPSPDTHNQQGSSDEPNEFTNDNDGSDSVQQEVNRARKGKGTARCSQLRSEASYPTSQSSGSKRRSTDDSGTEGANRKRENYRNKARKQRESDNRLAEAGYEIAKCMRESNGMYGAEAEMKDKCVNKLVELGVQGKAEDFAMAEIEANHSRRIWILRSSEEAIWNWILRHVAPASFTSMLHNQNQGPNYANVNMGPSNYGFPPPHNNHGA